MYDGAKEKEEKVYYNIIYVRNTRHVRYSEKPKSEKFASIDYFEPNTIYYITFYENDWYRGNTVIKQYDGILFRWSMYNIHVDRKLQVYEHITSRVVI